MDDAKPFASLGPTLLARKGGAKPAMRPQLAGVTPMGGGAAAQALAADLEDLGWNDMGEEDAVADRSADVLQLTPAPANPEAEAKTDIGSPRPIVKSMHEELAERLAQESETAEDRTVPLRKRETPLRAVPDPQADAEIDNYDETPASKRSAKIDRRRAAFTLRLDAKRHLKLRLASTVRNRSAQQLVTEALDRFLRDIPEIESLARQVRPD
jgi:hypothetical protein